MPDNTWNATLYDQKHAFVSEYGKGVLSLLEPQKGETILDLGCGTGALAQQIAESGAHVVGIDASSAMIEKAREIYPGIEFLVSDAREFSFPYQFDAIFSNATLHWISEAERVVERMRVALRPGGRLVVEFGGKGNVESITTALQEVALTLAGVELDARWYFPSIGEYATLLEKHGFEVQRAWLFDRPTKLEDGEQGLANWITMFGGHIVSVLPPDVKQQVIARVETMLRPKLFRDGSWYADYRRLRIVARG